MNENQKAHSKHIRDTFAKLQEAKFEAGAKEHGTILNELDTIWLLKEALNEFVDGFTYVLTAIEQLESQITVEVDKENLLKYLKKLKSTTDKSAPK